MHIAARTGLAGVGLGAAAANVLVVGSPPVHVARGAGLRVLRLGLAPTGTATDRPAPDSSAEEPEMAWVRSLANSSRTYVILTGDLLRSTWTPSRLAKTLEPLNAERQACSYSAPATTWSRDRQPFKLLHQRTAPGDVHTATTDRRTGIRTAERRMARTEQCRG